MLLCTWTSLAPKEFLLPNRVHRYMKSKAIKDFVKVLPESSSRAADKMTSCVLLPT